MRTTDGVNLHVVDEGTGPVTVLLGGYGMPSTGWSVQKQALLGAHRVITMDRRCHGRSDRVPYGQRMSRHGKDVAELLDALDLTDVLLVGSSMGSNTVLAYIDLFGCARLRGAVLVDQTPKMVNEGDWELGFYGLTRASLNDWVWAFPGDLVPFHTMPDPEVLAGMVDGPEFSVEDTRGLLRDHAEKDWRDVLPRIDVPVLAVAGRHSPVWPCESSEWMAQAAPHGTYAVFEQSGHVPFLEEPSAFNDLLLGFAGA